MTLIAPTTLDLQQPVGVLTYDNFHYLQKEEKIYLSNNYQLKCSVGLTGFVCSDLAWLLDLDTQYAILGLATSYRKKPTHFRLI